MPQISMHTPVGDLIISKKDNRIVSLDWGWSKDQTETVLLIKAKKELDEYFDGQRKKLNLPLNPPGSTFLRKAWNEILDIPYGMTVTYGKPSDLTNSTPHAIGRACAKNLLPILVSCHRVLGVNAKLVGYSGGGVQTKISLLRLEGTFL